ncbi:hypothetical protein Cgig2_018523 [Carnegiea gigantea]|uniref:Uncharacterized protein n=1 Tax=Carnegiea gigantea TaxID=171969 RepID=A0A9Q1GUA8_9CARY|nr:hypothetical protein Cgig2_018523 [Carnegiea gigantea]
MQINQKLNGRRSRSLSTRCHRRGCADIIPEKMVVWLVRNFDTCSCSLPLANGRMRATDCDVHVMLGLPMGRLEVVESENEIDMTVEFRNLLNCWKQQWLERHSILKCEELVDMIQGQVDRGKDFKRNFVIFVVSIWLRGGKKWRSQLHDTERESITGFGRGSLEDMLDKTSMTDEEEQVNEKEHHSKGVKDEGKAEDQIGISKVKVITSNRWLAEVITELEELIPGGCSPLKRVRKVAMESVSDAHIRDTLKRSKSRTLVLLQDSYEFEGFLMQIDAIEKHFADSRDKFTIPRLSLGVSQEEKESLLEGVIIVDSEPDSLVVAVQVINCEVEDVVTRCMMTSAQCISTPLLCQLLCFYMSNNAMLPEDNGAFIDRSLMRIVELDLQI